MTTIAVVAAYNEAPRILPVLDALLASRSLDGIVVVDDGSSDDTTKVASTRARSGSATESFLLVERLAKNGGKGRAMLAGVKVAFEHGADVVFFCDADLRGFRARHADRLVRAVSSGDYEMAVGISDYGALNSFVLRAPLISGQRAVSRRVLERVPLVGFDGFGIEVWLNDTAARFFGPNATGVATLDGVELALKWEKDGSAKGSAKMVDMAAEVVLAMQKIVQYYETDG